jgi:hypothetical protein
MVDCHKCDICDKLYSSYKSLWKHNKNIHKSDKNKDNHNIIISNHNITKIKDDNKKYSCKYCNNEFSQLQNRWRHEQKCKIIFDDKEQQTNEIKIAQINKEIKLAEINKEKEIELAKLNQQIELKKLEIKKENSITRQKLHNNPTIKNINRLLQNKINMVNSNLTSNSNNTTNIQNNTINNHFKIECFGKENILDTITDKEKKLIINQGCNSIEKLVEITCAGKYDQFKNIVITNKRDNFAYVYDEKVGLFVSCDKNTTLNKLVTTKLEDVEEIYNEFDENNKLTESNRKIMSKFFIKFIDEDEKYIDENSNNKEYKNYIEYKVNKINNLLFNNQNKIIHDVTLAIENKQIQ